MTHPACDPQPLDSLEQIPKSEGWDLRWSSGWTRTQFLKRAVGGAMALSVASLGFLPTRRSFATHAGQDPYQIYQSCPSYAASHDCVLGCGPSRVCVSGDCCITNPADHKVGWHKREGNVWKVRANACVSGTGYDGWLWRFDSTCGCCRSGLTYRCHDGFKCNSSGGSCEPTICRWVKECYGNRC